MIPDIIALLIALFLAAVFLFGAWVIIVASLFVGLILVIYDGKT